MRMPVRSVKELVCFHGPQQASLGVVDANCRVHGMGNLYVAGSSTFPTGATQTRHLPSWPWRGCASRDTSRRDFLSEQHRRWRE